MPTTEEELQKLRDTNEKLREQITDANTKRAENEATQNREIESVRLQAENTRLEAELVHAKEAAKAGSTKEGASNLLEQAQAQLEQAQAVAAQKPGPVDTNAENQPSGTTGATEAVEGGTVETSPEGVTTVKSSGSSKADKSGGNS